MSILINMEMPKNCNSCRLLDWSNGCCSLTNEATTNRRCVYRMAWCPLIELPPHGDLIDRDALFKTDRYVYGNDGLPIGVRHIVHGNWQFWDKACPQFYSCDICGFHSLSEYNFCPNCGARMKSEE